MKARSDVRDSHCVIRIRITQCVKSNQRKYSPCVKRKIRKVSNRCDLRIALQGKFLPWFPSDFRIRITHPIHASLNEPWLLVSFIELKDIFYLSGVIESSFLDTFLVEKNAQAEEFDHPAWQTGDRKNGQKRGQKRSQVSTDI